MAADVMQQGQVLRTEPNARTDLRIATIGNVDSGKSTIVGVLTRNILDDGAGKARSNVFHHKHEKETGRSSAVSVELMGFAGKEPVSGDLRATRQKRWQEIRSHSERSVTFVDLCGHEKYLKTTIYGMTALLPDYAMVLVGANMGVARQTREHIGIAAALSLPIMIIVTKIDIAPPEVAKATMEQITKVLKQARRMPFVVRSMANVATAAKSILSDRITPIFQVSSVTGEGLDMLRELLATMPPRISSLVSKGEAFKMQGALGGSLADKTPKPGSPPVATPGQGTPGTGTGEEGGMAAGSGTAEAMGAGGAPGGGPSGSSPLRPAVAGAEGTAKGRGTDGEADAAAGNGALQIATGEGQVARGVNRPASADAARAVSSTTGTYTPSMVTGTSSTATGADGDGEGAGPIPARQAADRAAGTAAAGGGSAGGGAHGHGHSDVVGETCIDSVFNVPGVGTVVAGTVLKGNIHVGSTMLLGPDRSGDWQPVTIRSIHVQYTPVEYATPGGSAAFAIRPKGKLKGGMDRRKPWVRKGMTLISPDAAPCSYWEFTAEVLVLHHQTTMRTGYAPIVHSGVVAQCAKIDRIVGVEDDKPIAALRTGDRALVTFRWLFKPEYVKPGDVLLFREGRAKGVGRIKAVQAPHRYDTAHVMAGASE